ncbi:uncharacterized protein LOC111392559 [Olea europaea var. sylvestris]|uniref:uncharacterized protein LOC111392559 n=1 Tax=Olea europaea var. sylvestris TaxID=158386 RepID=UPI000C1D879D|nr:uncharacterized protein LOC111392559 [Olea europaea var. sylvestris]
MAIGTYVPLTFNPLFLFLYFPLGIFSFSYEATACDRPSSLGAVIIFIPLIVSVRLPAIMIVPWDIVRRHKREINNQTPSEYSLDEVKYRAFTSKYASRKVQQIGYGYQNEGAASILTSCLISVLLYS